MQLPLLFATSAAINTTINLPSYGTYAGTTLTSDFATNTTLPRPVNAWLNVEFATQPLGEHRFAKAAKAQPFEGVRDASEYGNICMQGPERTRGYSMGEDCLSMNIFRPVGVDIEEKLPVAAYIYGGAFNYGSARSVGAERFVGKSDTPVMMVTFGYRLGVFGFPSSPAFAELDLLNLGFTDQVLALEFIKENIEHFGGDPDRVTLMGLSAGAHSVGYHYLDVDAGPPMFSKAVMFSGGPTARQFPGPDFPLYINQWEQFTDEVGCGEVADEGQFHELLLECLREKDVEVVNRASYSVWNKYQYETTWPWQPVLGGPLIPRPAHESWDKQLFHKLPLVTGFCADEGRFFAPHNLSTNQQFLDFFENLLPGLSQANLLRLQDLYPDPVVDETSPYVHSPVSPQFARTAAAFGDFAYICGAQESVVRVGEGGVTDVWKYHFLQNNSWPEWVGIPHSCDLEYLWDGGESEVVGEFYLNAMARFVGEGVVPWERYMDGEIAEKEKVGKQLRIVEGGMEMEDDSIRTECCEFWRGVPEELYR